MEITCVTIDCADPVRVGAFWNDALGWGGVDVVADGSGAVCRSPGVTTFLEFICVPESEAGKNRVHLGCSAGALDGNELCLGAGSF